MCNQTLGGGTRDYPSYTSGADSASQSQQAASAGVQRHIPTQALSALSHCVVDLALCC